MNYVSALSYDVTSAAIYTLACELILLNTCCDIYSAGNFRHKVRIPRIEAGQLLGKILDNKADPAGDNGSYTSTTKEANLPKLEPTFSGEVTEWQTFWHQFCAVVDDSLLKGDAKLAIHNWFVFH